MEQLCAHNPEQTGKKHYKNQLKQKLSLCGTFLQVLQSVFGVA